MQDFWDKVYDEVGKAMEARKLLELLWVHMDPYTGEVKRNVLSNKQLREIHKYFGWDDSE